ncbi:hypothetical protein LAG90_05535 [Marinilongibacter aquaticus]|uniref:hypothetical protein n=1 Tax=Marinilongibacter aquaticus TaxID=2975157 RepID=UPI0021BD7292|nr:hypothetical protein [Marinilongibacter aquaticus]UBM60102.1 hypothetical protein LAG90_05535 [Marinilongibacter aquaticus]
MKNILFFVVFGCIILSCSPNNVVADQELASDNQSLVDVKITNGVLEFSSKQHLLNVIKEIEKSNNMENWYNNSEFRSLLQRQNKLREADLDHIANTGELGSQADVLFFREDNGELILEKIVEDPRFAAVLNENSFVIVDNVVYHIGEEGVAYISLAENKKILPTFLKNPSMEGATFEKTKAEYFKNVRMASVTDATVGDPYNSNRRIVAEFVRHYSVVYISLVVKMRCQKKNWIGWSNTNCYSMNFSASGVFSEAGVNFPFSGTRSGTNVEEITMFVDEVYNLSLNWVSTSGTGSFKCSSSDPSSTSFSF